MKKLLIPIVNRTNYTKLRPVILQLKKYNVQVSVLLSSGIVPRKITDSANDIYEDGLNVIHELDCLLFNDSLESMVKSLGISLIDHATTLSLENPDALLVVGDRYDMMGPVLSARIMNIPILHIQGGETSGSIDNTVRNIITLCSCKHYVSTVQSYKKVTSLMGESGVYRTGCPAVEYMVNIEIPEYLHTDKFHKHFKDDFNLAPGEPYFLIIAHPDTTNPNDIDMECLLASSLSFSRKCIVIYPNIDAFHESILRVIRGYKNRVACIKHAPMEDFVQLMAHAACMIGNSSSGIRESASFKVPVVNVGERQWGREKNDNTIDSTCNYSDLITSIKKAININMSGENIYYRKSAASFIAGDITEFLKKA